MRKALPAIVLHACAAAPRLLTAIAIAAAIAAGGSPAERPPLALFEPTWESLGRYTAPEWFRDAKFGIWAAVHTPSDVPVLKLTLIGGRP